MFDIGLSHYNEKLRYETDMDWLRALALWATRYRGQFRVPGMPQPREYVFDLIKHYSSEFATDIRKRGDISSETTNRFHSALTSVFQMLHIEKADIEHASQQQRFRNSGFWGEMRRCIGQFGDLAESASADGVTHIITAAVSGCVIGEYVGQFMPRSVPVDHMIFSRQNTNPVSGHLSNRFSLSGSHLLFVDDIVMEAVTAKLMVKEVRKISRKNLRISLLTIDVDPSTEKSGFLRNFSHVYRHDEI